MHRPVYAVRSTLSSLGAYTCCYKINQKIFCQFNVNMYFVSENPDLITASTPIIMTENGNEAVVAVVGAQLRYSKFYDLFMNTTKLCSSSSNEVLCHDLCRNDVSKFIAFSCF